MKFGEKVRELRKEKGLTQHELADILCISLRTMIGYEKGETYPRNREIYTKLAEFFGVSTNYLLTEDDICSHNLKTVNGSDLTEQAQCLIRQLDDLLQNGELTEDDMKEIMTHIQDIYWIVKKRARKKALSKNSDNK